MRFVLSVRAGCLNRIIPLSERHLRRIISEFVEHYHTERNHQPLDNERLAPLPEPANDDGAIVCRDRLGGVLKHYYRQAA